jgi:hypothetical protein
MHLATTINHFHITDILISTFCSTAFSCVHVSVRPSARREQKKFFPEESFINGVKAIPGVSTVETQTYTLMPVN